MKQSISRLIHFASAAALTAVSCAATADEAEIFVGLGNAVTAERPNILFIIDTSGSMTTNVTTQVPFNPSTVYAGTCLADRVYFESGTDASDPPSCTNGNSVPLAAFKCQTALDQMAIFGSYVATPAAQWRGAGPRWRNINGNTAANVWVECQADAGTHGDGVNLTQALGGGCGPGPLDREFGPGDHLDCEQLPTAATCSTPRTTSTGSTTRARLRRAASTS